MKKMILMLLFVLGLVYGAFAQQYVPFPTANANWNVIYAGSACSDIRPDTLLLRYSLHGDTIINNQQYSRLCLETGDTLHPEIRGIGGIREENKKIYYVGYSITTWNPEEWKLYDFNATKGDTIWHDNQKIFFTIIEDVDSVLIGSSYRKRYKAYINYMYPTDYIIEGIGSVVNSLLGRISPIPTCGSHYWEHICFKHNGEQLYLNPTMQECFPARLLASVKSVEQTPALSVYPTLFNDRISVESVLPLSNCGYSMVNMFGKVVASGRMHSNEINGLSPLTSGLYLLQIRASNGAIIACKKLQKGM